MKTCGHCGISKDTSEFHKKKSSKDGLQHHCKTCSSKLGKFFRNELRPDYYWGENGYFTNRHDETLQYVKDYQRADKTIKIYCIETPDGCYIGATKRHFHIRVSDHWDHYKGVLDGRFKKRQLPYLHNSFRKYSNEQVKEFLRNSYLLEEVDGDRTSMYKKEKEWVLKFQSEGKTLLNKILKTKKN